MAVGVVGVFADSSAVAIGVGVGDLSNVAFIVVTAVGVVGAVATVVAGRRGQELGARE